MQNYPVKNEKGITLIELLAALSLFGVVILLVSGVIVQLMGSEQTVSEDLSLKQESNVAMSDLRKQFYDGKKQLCYSPANKNIKINKVTLGVAKEKKVTNNCFDIDTAASAKDLAITFSNQDKSEYTVHTSWQKTEPYTLTLASPKEEEEEEKPIENDEKDYGNENGDCDYYGNTKFIRTQMGTWNTCPNPWVHDGSAWFPNQISIFQGITLTVDKNLFADKTMNLEHNAKLIAKKSIRLKDTSTFKSKSTANIAGSLFALKPLTLQEDSVTQVGKNIVLNDELKLMGNAKLTGSGNFSIHKNFNLQENNQINVLKNATFSDHVRLMGNAQLTIKGDALFNKDLHFQENSKILVEGNATVKGKVTPEWGAGAICIKGNATFQQNLYTNLKVRRNATECFKPSGYNIYLMQ